jgi:hypothetical protein
MTEGLANDIWIESDGKKVGMFEVTVGANTSDKSGNLQGLSNGIFYIRQLCHVERATVQAKGSGWVAGTAIKGYSGNQIQVCVDMSGGLGAGTTWSGHSGNVLTFTVMGQ